ncbi:DnaJ-domain-containing protein [Dirofilaria immitis]|nr:DnaJ-domain-containing protein [Dirofilaria immitis]
MSTRVLWEWDGVRLRQVHKMQLSGLDLAIYGFNRNIRKIEKAGISYELRIIRDKLTLGLSTEPILKQLSTAECLAENWASLDSAEGNATYVMFFKSLDPKRFKDQDHYKVLGLSNLRWQANISQIRTAYRAKVLKHHPDKNNAISTEASGAEGYFTCITKAYEQLGLSEQKRRAYDSVDPLFDDSIPDEKTITSDNFYDILAPVFIRNSRWSVQQPVPLLGNISSVQVEVDRFYSFWFNWDSWREFSYLDEEDKEKGEDRWERREIEKINKIEREKRRKNEMKRIRNLVEMAYRKDPRVALFREQEKLKKEKQKNERRKILEEKKAEDEKKKLGKNYWDANVSSKLSCLEVIEHICLRFDAVRLNEITAKLELVNSFTEAMDILNDQIHKEVPESVEPKNEPENATDSMSRWSSDEITLLVKATTLYPVGTIKRWSEIANYVNEHRENKNTKKKTEKDVLIQVKTIKSLNNIKDQKKVKDILVNSAKGTELEWKAEEQKLLETALKNFLQQIQAVGKTLPIL